MALVGDSLRDYKSIVSNPIILSGVKNPSFVAKGLQQRQIDNGSFDTWLSRSVLHAQLDSVAIEWSHWRNGLSECTCNKKFDLGTTGVGIYCRTCGLPYCIRCIDKAILPGHFSGKPVPVCMGCVQKIATKGPKAYSEGYIEKDE